METAPGKIFETQDGSHSIFSEAYGVSYHSRYGAIQESRHVFIEAGLYPLLLTRQKIKVLEIGFGTGLNAFLTFLETTRREVEIHYRGIEAYPITAEQARQLNYPAQLQWDDLRPVFLSMHDDTWGETQQLGDRFYFRKDQIRIEALVLEPAFDLIYFDAFAPNAQPELWEEPILSAMYQALTEQGVLVTYCAKGVVKRILKNLGFSVESLPGPPGKREMTRAVK